jgi:hypothetical protein
VKASDVSNYDSDFDAHSGSDWVAEFKAAGIEGLIIGSQWMDKAWLRDAERGRPGKARRVMLAWQPAGAADGGPGRGPRE